MVNNHKLNVNYIKLSFILTNKTPLKLTKNLISNEIIYLIYIHKMLLNHRLNGK